MAAFVAIVCFKKLPKYSSYSTFIMKNILYYLAKSAVIIAIAVILYYLYTSFFVWITGIFFRKSDFSHVYADARSFGSPRICFFCAPKMQSVPQTATLSYTTTRNAE